MAQVLNRSMRNWWKGSYSGVVYRYRDGEVVCEEALRLLNSLRDNCATLVFLDPPFNLGKAYGNNGKRADRKSEADYREYMTKVLARAAEVLEPGGALYLYHIPKWAIQLTCDIPSLLEFRHWIAISIKSGFVRGQRLYPAHYALLYYTKGKPKAFNRPKIPRPVCARCKKDLCDYGGYKKFVEGGINLSDIWDDISPVRHKNIKHRNSNELPSKLVSRILTISGIRGGLVIDPFAGAGSMLIAARQANMRFVGGDIDREFLDIINERLLGKRPACVHFRREK